VSSKVAGFKAGADDYVVKPAAPAELVARIRASLRTEDKPLAHIVAVWGTKGGVGATTVAANLAVSLRTKTKKRVTLMDAAVLGGMVEILLNLPPAHTMADLLPRLYDLDAELLSSVLAKHSSGITALLSAPASVDGSEVQPEHLERILSWLQPASDYIVVDTSPSLDDSTLTMLQLANQVSVIVTPEMTSLRNARTFLNVAENMQSESQEFTLVLNRYPMPGGLSLRDIEGALRAKIAVQIPADQAVTTYAINRGIPVVTSHPRSGVAKGIQRLADAVIRTEKESPRAAIMSAVLARRPG
jgi:pilus assembly protein CpaE